MINHGYTTETVSPTWLWVLGVIVHVSVMVNRENGLVCILYVKFHAFNDVNVTENDKERKEET